MKKLIIGMIVSSTIVFGCGCIDTGTAMSLSQISLQKYYQQDSEIAQEINKLIDDIYIGPTLGENDIKYCIDICKELGLEEKIKISDLLGKTIYVL